MLHRQSFKIMGIVKLTKEVLKTASRGSGPETILTFKG